MRNNWLFGKLTLYMILFISLICISTISIVYYWSYYNYGNLFEDRVIHSYTHEKNQEMGIYNEWILGVTTDSIDVVEAIHTKEVAEHILEQAHAQEEMMKVYREKISDKHLLYMIELDYENEEYIYKYSILKDIYVDMFFEMFLSFLLLIVIIFALSIIFIKAISGELYKNITTLTKDIRGVAYSQEYKHIKIDSKDKDIITLVNSFNHMKDTLHEKENLEQSMLQYISHELKTPIMIIESYAESAKENIFPKGDLNSSLITITNQTHKLTMKVEDLLLIAKNTANYSNEFLEQINISSLIVKILGNLEVSFHNKEISLAIEEDLMVYGYLSKIEVLLENLIHNQLKFSNNLLKINCSQNETQIFLEFYNDGDVVDSNTKKNLFKPFSKGYNGSSGLGLSICMAIVRIHKGNIFLEDTKEGALFKVVLSKNIE